MIAMRAEPRPGGLSAATFVRLTALQPVGGLGCYTKMKAGRV
jgi:hypothetical protein